MGTLGSKSACCCFPKDITHTLRRGQVRVINSKHVIPLLLLHVGSLEVRLIKNKAVRACSAVESVQATRILVCGISTPYGQAVCAIRANCCHNSEIVYKFAQKLTCWGHICQVSALIGEQTDMVEIFNPPTANSDQINLEGLGT